MAKVNGRNDLHRITTIVTSMKVNINLIRRMDLVYSLGKVVIHIKVNTLKMKDVALVKWNGLTEVFIKVSGMREFRMA